MFENKIQNPAPADPTATLIHKSDTDKATALGMIGAEIMGIIAQGGTASDAIQAYYTIASEKLDAELERTELELEARSTEEANRHEEAMKELEVREKEASKGPEVDTSDFIA